MRVRAARARTAVRCLHKSGSLPPSDGPYRGLSQHVQRPVACTRAPVSAVHPTSEHMMQTLKRASISLLLCIVSLPAAAQGVDDGHDKEWRQLTDTTGATWNQLAAVCPRDGQTPCAGSVGTVDLTGWVWATDAQALALFSYTEPAIIGNRSIAGMPYFGSAQTFQQSFRPTFSSCQTYFCNAFTGGWTSSTDADGAISGSASWGMTNVSLSGAFGVASGANPDGSSSWVGAFLFHPTGPGV